MKRRVFSSKVALKDIGTLVSNCYHHKNHVWFLQASDASESQTLRRRLFFFFRIKSLKRFQASKSHLVLNFNLLQQALMITLCRTEFTDSRGSQDERALKLHSFLIKTFSLFFENRPLGGFDCQSAQ